MVVDVRQSASLMMGPRILFALGHKGVMCRTAGRLLLRCSKLMLVQTTKSCAQTAL